ncbi:Subtilase family protein [Aquimarina amphilecti]|uniref:Subtilase family protein n=1 Tax=Aquimarina amphilecti TaxID=1038014 RepID=A0A1H7T5I1_AQUAM|nr:S8 family serine peptidase [Aquimarina amphilecti]SEL79775.1 Subtilase family protein [Aquimarina amphilecti]
MNYWKKRAEKFQKLKEKYDSSFQEPSPNGRYIILSQNDHNANRIEKNIKRSDLNYEPISYDKVIRQKKSIDNVLSEKKVIVIKKTGIGIIKLSDEEFKSSNKHSDFLIIPDLKIQNSNQQSSEEILTHDDPNAKMTYGIRMGEIKLDSHFKGKQVSIAILDTGIDKKHPDLKDKIADGKSWVDNENDFCDTNGHGTHCAGIIVGGMDSNGLRYGVAPEAKLFVGKVLDHNGEGFLSNLLCAIDWAIKNECNIISMSLTSKLYDISNAVHSDLFEKAEKKRIVMIAAAGNNSDHSSGTTHIISNPAASHSVIAVGAIDEYYKLYNKSNVGVYPRLPLGFVAPGVDIYSTWLSKNGERNYKTCTGTSASAPFIAGIFALTISKFHNNRRINSYRRRASPEQLLNAINRNVLDPWDNSNLYGIGLPLAPK